jgi:hypothetical protein
MCTLKKEMQYKDAVMFLGTKMQIIPQEETRQRESREPMELFLTHYHSVVSSCKSILLFFF